MNISNPRYYPSDGIQQYYHGEPVDAVPSVTTVLKVLAKPALIQWAANQAVGYIEKHADIATKDNFADILYEAKSAHRQTKETAGDRGTNIHQLVEDYFAETPNPKNKEEETILGRLDKWAKKYNIEPLMIEEIVSGDGYAGRVDLTAEVDSALWENKRWCRKRGLEYPRRNRRVNTVIDFKNSKGYYDNFGLQTAAYRSALGGMEANGVCRIDPKTLSINYKDFSGSFIRDAKAFQMLVEFYWLQCTESAK